MAKQIIARGQVTLTTLQDGQAGPAGADANMLDWVKNWNTNKTVIYGETLITPKIFAGYKTALDSITGVAMGHMDLLLFNGGSYTIQTVDGLFGFKNGVKTFSIDTEGNTQLGNGTQYIKYNSNTGKVEFGSDVSLNWVGATYIDKNGIFTGTLSANTVNAVRINATQINAGTIDAARINVAALKAELITAANIEALTLNVTKGKIGGWSIDADSIFSGTKNNTAAGYTANATSITIGSLGIRGYKWKLDATGAGALAGGNISWDASGNVTFDASIVLNWKTPLDAIESALGGTSYPKLTQISGSGIYTGTLNASQITAGTISAERIAAGSINSSKLDANSIKTDIINASYVNGLNCSFVQGKIGGWSITSDTIRKNNIVLSADGSIVNGTLWQLNNDGSGQFANGNISWNVTGTVTFGASVSLNWTNVVSAAKLNYRHR